MEDESQFSLDDLLAVEDKFHDSQIQYYICKRYMENDQYEESFSWAEKSAEQGSSEAAKELGNMYYFGDMVKKNYKESLKWYKIAADNGDEYSQNNLQFMFCNDEVVEYKEDSWISLCEKLQNKDR